jgi:hypothetical protein
MTMKYPANIREMTPEVRIDFYSTIFLQDPVGLEEFNELPADQRRHILQDLLADGDATGTWVISRERLVEFLDDTAHMRYLAIMDELRALPEDDLPFDDDDARVP